MLIVTFTSLKQRTQPARVIDVNCYMCHVRHGRASVDSGRLVADADGRIRGCRGVSEVGRLPLVCADCAE
ncbi:hypothetical protein SAMN05216284_102365 [Micromonospora sediminimaris]|nr:hypothetical protein SAMN05216284_102365 [Micromonospora sediminimaris]